MLSMAIGVIGAVIALVGWFGFGSVIALIVGTVLYLIETAMEWQSLNANAKMLDVVIFIVGCIVAKFTAVPWYVGGLIAINIYNAVTAVIGLIPMIKFFCR